MTLDEREALAQAADRIPALKKAHTVYERFRRSGRPIPFQIRVLDARYHAQFPRPRPRPASGFTRRGDGGVRPPAPPAVADAIRQAREAAGMSRRSLAAAVGVSAKAVEHWEHARRAPGKQSWVQMELTLGPLGVVREAGQQRGEAHEHAA